MQKGFLIKHVVLIAIIVIVVAGYFLFIRQYSVSPTDSSKMTSPVSQDETKDWKTYRNEEYGFEFKYPAKYIIKTEQEWGGGFETHFVTTSYIPNKSRAFHLVIESIKNRPLDDLMTYGLGCMRGPCSSEVVKKISINGLVWDYMGSEKYCSGKDKEHMDFCSVERFAYRMIQNDLFYFMYFDEENEKMNILSTFKFTK